MKLRVKDTAALQQGTDREFRYQVLPARESLGSKAIGAGIAITHARDLLSPPM
jgi:mannitol/fructose-specific phosphotransferase system IIA component (Ntr-type)